MTGFPALAPRVVGRWLGRPGRRGSRLARFRRAGRDISLGGVNGRRLGRRHKLLQARRPELGGLEEAEDVVTIDDSQAAIHTMMEGNAPAGEVETNG